MQKTSLPIPAFILMVLLTMVFVIKDSGHSNTFKHLQTPSSTPSKLTNTTNISQLHK
jgi:hypothetical protein